MYCVCMYMWENSYLDVDVENGNCSAIYKNNIS